MYTTEPAALQSHWHFTFSPPPSWTCPGRYWDRTWGRSLSYCWIIRITLSLYQPSPPEVPDVVVLQKRPQPEEARETVHPVIVLAVPSPLTWGPPHQTVEGGSEPHYKTVPLCLSIDLIFLCTESVVWYQVKHTSFEGLTSGEMIVR